MPPAKRARAVAPRRETVRQGLHRIMEPYTGRASGWASLAVDLFILACITASCVLVVIDTTGGPLAPERRALHFRIEAALTTIFVVEYLVRWYAAPRRWIYPLTFFAVIDLLAILPSLLMLGTDLMLLRAVRGIRLLRLLRLFRLVRVLKMVRYGFLMYRAMLGLRIWGSSVNHQYHLSQLARLLFWVVLAWFVGANVVHLTESKLAPGRGPFADYWTSYWNIIIVLISGIEDKEPVSLLARIEVVALLIAGICVVGMLTGEIVAILVRKGERVGKVAVKPPQGGLSHHVLILGRSSQLDPVIRQVHAALDGRTHILVVAEDAEQLPVTDPAVYRRVFALNGDPVDTRVLERADVDRAARVIVLSDDEQRDPVQQDNRSMMIALAIMGRGRDVATIVQLQSEESLRFVSHVHDVEFLVSRGYGEKLIGQAVLNPGVSSIYQELLDFVEDGNELYTVAPPQKLRGKTFAEAQLHFLDHDAEPVVLLGVDRSPPGRPHSRVFLAPRADEELRLGDDDRLVVMAETRPVFAAVNKEQLWSGAILPRR